MEMPNRIIEKIKEEKIRPIPKLYFTGKNILVWLLFIVSIFIGATSFSIILFSIQQTDFSPISHLRHSKIELFLGLLPFFWIILLILFLFLSTLSIYYSKRGYKFRWSGLVMISTAFSILLGTFFFIAGGAGKLETVFALNTSLYESIQEKKIKVWMNPDDGFLAGQIESARDSSFILTDFNKKSWEVDLSHAFIPPVLFLEKGETVKLIGKISAPNRFEADEVRPWGGPQRRMDLQGKRQKMQH